MAAPAQSTQNTQDLLADIFGSSSSEAASPAAQPPPGAAKSVNDILGLFGSTPSATPTPPSYTSPTTTSNPLFGLAQAQPPPPQAQAQPQAQSYTVYDSHELKITLTPQVSPAKPGLVLLMARFQVSGSTVASNVNFQVAVPRVSYLMAFCEQCNGTDLRTVDSTTADAADVELHCHSRSNGDAGIARSVSCRGEPFPML